MRSHESDSGPSNQSGRCSPIDPEANRLGEGYESARAVNIAKD